MDEQILIASESGKDFLAHYGIKGQQWGNRRYQNEDGSLTPEGRKRYGLNPKYSNMSDNELRDLLNKKRTQNQYVDLMTAGAKKKKSDIAGLIRETSNVADKTVSLVDKTYYANMRDYADSKQKKLQSTNKALEAEKKELKANAPSGTKADTSDIEDKIKENKDKISEYKDYKDDIKNQKEALSSIAQTPGKIAEPIATIATKGEIKEKTQEAYRNIQEMDADQLKKTVDRILLERQYEELVNPPPPSKIERGREIMQTAGSIIAIAGGIAGFALTMKKLLDKKHEASDLIEAGEDFLAHYRTKGSKNGVRRYQNEDGSLTPEGYRHYGIDPNGRQAADPRELLARQRAQQQMQRERFKAQTKQQTYMQRTQAKEAARQNAYTQKIQARAALREAKTQARMQAIFDRQNLATQRQAQKQELQAKAENRANIRKNIIKGVAATAAIAGAIGIGYHFLHNRSLDLAHGREMEKMTLEGKNKINEIFAQGKVDVKKIGAQGKVDIAKIGKQGEVDIKKIGEQGIQDRLKIGKQSEADVAKINAESNKKINEIREQGIANVNLKTREGQNAVELASKQGENRVQELKAYLPIEQEHTEQAKYAAEAAKDKGALEVLRKQEEARRKEEELRRKIKEMNAKWKENHPDEYTFLQQLKAAKGSNNAISYNGTAYTSAQLTNALKSVTGSSRKSISSLKPEELSQVLKILFGK